MLLTESFASMAHAAAAAPRQSQQLPSPAAACSAATAEECAVKTERPRTGSTPHQLKAGRGAGAAHPAPPPPLPHPWVGRRISKDFDGKLFRGKVTAHEPARHGDKAAERPAQWHVMYEDGDEEDLEEHELLPLYAQGSGGAAVRVKPTRLLAKTVTAAVLAPASSRLDSLARRLPLLPALLAAVVAATMTMTVTRGATACTRRARALQRGWSRPWTATRVCL